MRDASRVLRNLSMIGQFGLSLATPTLMCLLSAYWLNTRIGSPLWIYIPALILGLGASFMTAWKLYQSIMQKRKKEDSSGKTAFNRHY
jgi:hypothetical protein